MRKDKISIIFLVIVMIILCSCSMSDENRISNERKKITSSEKDEMITTLNNMHNQYNAYRICEEDEYVIRQLTLKGELEKTYKLMRKDKKITMLGIAYITNKEIFYKLDKNGKCELWVVPLEHYSNKEYVQITKKRLLFRTKEVIEVLYADDDYIAYKAGWCYKEYDRNHQKKILVNDERKRESYSQPDSFIIHRELSDNDVNAMIVLSKDVGVNNYPQNIYLHKVGSGKVKKIADTYTSKKWNVILASSNNRVYYTGLKKDWNNKQSWDIWCYDFETNRNYCLLKEKQLKDTASFSEITDIFFDQNELWVETDNRKCKFMYFSSELLEKQSETVIKKPMKLNQYIYSLYNEKKDVRIVRVGDRRCLLEEICENFVRIRCFDIIEEGERWMSEQFYNNMRDD